jgi:hypothetical protein
MSYKQSGVFWVAVSVLLACAQAPAATVTFSDSAFNLSDYQSFQWISANAPSTQISFSRNTSNPSAPALELMYTIPAVSTFDSVVALINTTFVYDPSTEGPVQAVNLQVNKYVTYNLNFNTNGVSFFVMQDGSTFATASVPLPTTQGVFQFGSATLQATDFSFFNFTTGATDNTLHPNFAGGGPLSFGLRSRFSEDFGVGTPQVGNVDIRFDPFVVTVNPVPEPGSMLLLLLGLGTITAWRLLWR